MRAAIGALSVLATLACAVVGCAGAMPPEPPPYSAIDAGTALDPAAFAIAEDAGTDAGAAPPPADPSPRVIVSIEPAYRIDKRSPLPAEERARWNEGGLGTLTGAAPEAEGHPMPRVIVDVTRVAGPHSAAELQRALRKLLWGKVIECYALGAYRNQALRGKTTISFRVSRSGAATGAVVKKSTLADAEVTKCLAAKPRLVPLPRAKAASGVTMEVQVGPGDDPMPPPASAIVPGGGALAEEAIRAAIEAARPRFEACYRPALAYAPELWGRLAIRLHVTAEGAVDEAFETESRFPDPRVAQCALRVARGLSFPRPIGGDLRFVAPIRFSSERSPAPAAGAP